MQAITSRIPNMMTKLEHPSQTILIITDDKKLLAMMRQTLQDDGFIIIEASSGQIGIKLSLSQTTDLIICDVTLPDMDGHDVMRQLRGDEATVLTPIVLMTDEKTMDTFTQDMELCADDILIRPIQQNNLRMSIPRQLARYQRLTADIQVQKEALQQTKKRLSIMVAHELRTPLVGLIMSQNVLEQAYDELTPEVRQQVLSSMGAGNRRLLHLVEQMVFMTQDVIIQDKGINRSCSEIVDAGVDLARQFDFRHLDVNLQLEMTAPDAQVKCNLSSIKHALGELVYNAMMFSPKGKEVIISQWQTDGQAWISVEDSGSGISAEALSKALESFEQINRDYQEQQGMGMGLPLAKRIIEEHGGTLKIETLPDQGTKVLVGLPTV